MAAQSDATRETLGFLSGFIAVLGILIAVVAAVLVIAALISIILDSDVTAGGKLLWFLGVLWLPLLGAVAWFVVGRRGHLNRFLGIDKGRGRHEGPIGPAGGHAAPSGPEASAAPA